MIIILFYERGEERNRMNNDSFEFKCPFDEQTNEEIIFFELTTKIVRKEKEYQLST